MTHTPGPWSVGGTRCLFVRETVIPILGADGRVYAGVLYSDKTKEQHIAAYANARLIAAAPDLLEALDRIADFAPGNGDVCEIIARIARAAIAKATSENGPHSG